MNLVGVLIIVVLGLLLYVISSLPRSNASHVLENFVVANPEENRAPIESGSPSTGSESVETKSPGTNSSNAMSLKPMPSGCESVDVKKFRNDVLSTNIVHFMAMKEDVKFVGVASSRRSLMILSKNLNLQFIEDVDIANTVVGYHRESDRVLANHLLDRVYDMKDVTYTKVSAKDKVYSHDVCEHTDFADNVLVDFMSSDAQILVLSVNLVDDVVFMSYMVDKFQTRVTFLNFVQKSTNVTKIHDYVFGSEVERNMLSMDEILYVPLSTASNITDAVYEDLINKGFFDFTRTKEMIDLYDCGDVPAPIAVYVNVTKKDVQDEVKYNEAMRDTSDSCQEDTKIKSIYNNSFDNPFGTHTYKTYRCSAPTNLFLDIVYPFSFDFTVDTSPLDVKTLSIQSETFDNVIPIKNAVDYDNTNIPRYKINVDMKTFPDQAYVDDIYYGTHKDETTGFSVLTNSIPVRLNKGVHTLVVAKDTYTKSVIGVKIEMLDDMIECTATGGQSVNVKVYEGDRVFVDPNSIFDVEVSNFLDAMLSRGENWYHGHVEAGNVIRLENVRESSVNAPNISGKCFNSKTFEDTKQSEGECYEEGTFWDTPCKYNHECPYFRANKNYSNDFGGCQTNGLCEMPRGVVKQSFKFTKDQPMCYGCTPEDDDDYECCNKSETPDYAFTNDTLSRVKALFQWDDDANLKCSNQNRLPINKYV